MRSPLFRNNNRQQTECNDGFTIVEMLVIVPVALIAIATLISLMVALVGDVLMARTRASAVYELQDTLNRIEADGRISTAYLASFTPPASPQGRNNDTTPFNAASPTNDLIFNIQATTDSPYSGIRNLVYYDNQPNSCASGNTQANSALTVRVIYFTVPNTDDGGATKSLWRRTIMPSWTLTAGQPNTVCSKPWQRGSCSLSQTLNATCQTYDELMLSRVTNFAPTYYDINGAVTADPQAAMSVSVRIDQSKQVAGETVTSGSAGRSLRMNSTNRPPTSAPVISVYNAPNNTLNNPVKSTFSWPNVQYATLYSIRYKVNAGGWVTVPDQSANTYSVTGVKPRDVITIEVIAKNELGSGQTGSYTYTTPIWTVANLINEWSCYDAAWPCPSYTLTSGGVVVFKGLAKGGPALSRPMFILPEELAAPRYTHIFQGVSAGWPYARIDVLTNGEVYWMANGSNTWISLDNVRYIPEIYRTAVTWTNPTYLCPSGCSQPWSNYNGGFQTANFTKDFLGRAHVYGILRIPTPYPPAWSSGITNIPAGYAPRSSKDDIYVSDAGNSYSNIGMGGSNNTTKFRIAGNSWQTFAYMYHTTSSTSTWKTPTMNAWQNYGFEYAGAEYTKDSDNMVIMHGLIKSGSVASGATIFTLDAGYRPKETLSFIVAGRGNVDMPARINVLPNGEVKFMGASGAVTNEWLSLAGISFYQEQ